MLGLIKGRDDRLPPGPKLPRALQTLGWVKRPMAYMEQCRERYGDMYTMRIANEGDWVVISDPALVKQVFTGSPEVFHAGEGNVILLPLLGSNSVLLLDEKPHLRQRKLLLPPFHGDRMQAYGSLMDRVARDEVRRWPVDEPFELISRMQAVTLEVILEAVFGLTEGPRFDAMRHELRRLLGKVMAPSTMALLFAVGPKRASDMWIFQRETEAVDRLIAEEIADRREQADLAERTDILSLLLAAKHEDGTLMDGQELRDELMTLLVAGHETTATALSWAIERLVRHPDKLARLRSEIDAGEDAYLDAVVTETLRVRPVLSVVVRMLTEDVELGGYNLPAGTRVVPAIHLVHRRPDIYPDPRAFRPERFLDQKPGTYTWFPFGGGVRRCLGASFAIFEMKQVLRAIVGELDLEPAAAPQEPAKRRAITLVPTHGATIVARRRSERQAKEPATLASV
ncbi:cytochrome P450 [Thermoleophilia bacterium SCSIO 60948]|nr:cytochrome P450 [Thermoleophilia bacterium SCSIO 60948]